MRSGLSLALYIGFFSLFLCAPARATIVVFGHHQGLSGQSVAQPGDEVPIYSVRLVNDGSSSLQAIALTLSDLSTGTGIGASAFAQLRLYQSSDTTFSAQTDSLLGTQSNVNLGTTTTVSLDAALAWSGAFFPYFIVTAVLNSSHTDESGAAKDAFRVGSAVGAVQTSSGNTGSEIVADNNNSVSIDVVASQIAFATQPAGVSVPNGDVVSGQIFATQPVLEARDANGNVDIDVGGSATISLQSGGVSLAGTTAQSWSNGRATFADLSVSATSDAQSFVLAGSAAGLSSASSSALTADIVATQLVFTQQSAHSGVDNGDVLSGVAFQTQPVVEAQNASGLVDAHFADQVSITTTAAGALSGSTTIQAQNGVAIFIDLAYTASIDQESFALTANDESAGSGGDLPATTATALTADIVATQIAFVTAPADGAANNGTVVSGQAFATQPVLEAQNAAGQRDLNYTGSITLSLPAGNPTLSGTVSETWISGRADFAGNGLRVTATADLTPFTLSAATTGGGGLSGQSAVLTADVIATQMVFLTEPADISAPNGDVVSEQVFATQPVLEARDDNGVVDLHYQGTAPTISLQSGAVSLSGATTRAWSQGRATFVDLSVIATSEGQSFTLAASNGSLPQVTTSALTADIVATQLVFTQQPAHSGVDNGDVFSGIAFQTQPVVQAQNASGLIDDDFSDQITLTAAGSLAGSTTVQAQNGVATFGDIAYIAAVDQESFTLTANDEATGSGGDLPVVAAAALAADIVATQIVFVLSPADASAPNGDVVSGQAFATQPVLEARNAAGQRDLNYSGSVTLALASGGVALFGTTSIAWNSGRADFANSGLGATASGDGALFSLRAQTSGLADATSAILTADIVATQIVFATLPADGAASNGDVVSGQIFTTQPVVEAQNAAGQRDLHLSGIPVTLSVSGGSIALSGTTVINWSSGQVAFSGIAANGGSDGDSFTLTASSNGLISAQRSVQNDIVATQLVFARQPAHSGVSNGDVLSGVVFQTQPIVEAHNAAGLIDVHFSDQIALATSAAGSLAGSTTVQAQNGVAAFTDLVYTASVDQESFVLVANDEATGSGGDLPAVMAAALIADIRATRLIFTQSPRSSAAIGDELIIDGQWTVQAVYSDGVIDVQFSDPIAIDAVVVGGTAAAAGTLTLLPGRTQVPSAGQVNYTSATHSQPGPIQLLAVSSGLESARSPTISITGSMALTEPVRQIEDQLAFQRDATPSQLPILAFRATPNGENLVLDSLEVRFELGGGLTVSHVEALQLWRDSGSTGALDPGDRLLGTAVLSAGARTQFSMLSDTLKAETAYLLTWSARSALQPDWTLLARVAAADMIVRSTQAAAVLAPVSGREIAGVLQRVGSVGQPYRLRLSATPSSLPADSLSLAQLVATIVDRQERIISTDDHTLVSFITLSGAALIDGPVVAQAQRGRAETSLRAGTRTGSARIRASAPGLVPDTLDFALDPGPLARMDLSISPQAILLDVGDSAEVRAELFDAYGNATGNGQRVQFSLQGAGSFVDGLSAVTVVGGQAIAHVRAAAPGTLRVVAASSNNVIASAQVPVVSTQPPFLTLSASRTEIPADGSTVAQLTVFLRDSRGQLLSADDSTRVLFSVDSGRALLSQNEAVANNGLASIQVRALGIAGPVLVRAEAAGLESAEFQFQARAAAPHRIDLVTLPAAIVADRQSTAVLSAVVRDSLGNLVPDAEVEISFLIVSGEAEIIGPQTASVSAGTARTTLRSSIRAGQVQLRAEAPGLLAAQTTLNLLAGPPAKIQLRASPAALPAGETAPATLIAEIQDVHGNRVSGDSTTVISFSVSGGPGAIQVPNFSRVDAGEARALLRSTGETGKILVFAGASGLAASTFEIPVRQSQPPRFMADLAPLLLEEDGPPVRLDLRALVEDGDSATEDLVFSLAAPADSLDLEIAAGILVAKSAVPNYYGLAQTTLIVRDLTGLEDRVTLDIEVVARNDAPFITSVSDTVITSDSLYVYRLLGSDPDGDVLSFLLLEGPQGMRFDRALGRAVWRVREVGVFPVRFAVSDGQEVSEQAFRIHVVSAAGRLTFSGQPPLRARRGRIYTYQPQLLNAPVAALHFTLIAAPPRMRVDSGTGLISWLPGSDDSTRVAVILRVSGDNEEATQRFQIRVVEGNEAPEIISRPLAQAWVDSLYLYSVRARDADDDALVYTIVQGPQDMRINPLNGLIAWVPSRGDIGLHEIVVRAYDGQLNDEQRFQLQVRSFSQPPQLTPLKGLALDASGAATLQLVTLVSDADDSFEDLSWTIDRVSGDLVDISYAEGDVAVGFAVSTNFVEAQIRLLVADPAGNVAERLLRLAQRESSDFNGDAAVDLNDFFTLVDAFGSSPGASNWNSVADLNGDGEIDFGDIFIFADGFKSSNAPGK